MPPRLRTLGIMVLTYHLPIATHVCKLWVLGFLQGGGALFSSAPVTPQEVCKNVLSVALKQICPPERMMATQEA